MSATTVVALVVDLRLIYEHVFKSPSRVAEVYGR
jgi:hypothetical protein